MTRRCFNSFDAEFIKKKKKFLGSSLVRILHVGVEMMVKSGSSADQVRKKKLLSYPAIAAWISNFISQFYNTLDMSSQKIELIQ